MVTFSLVIDLFNCLDSPKNKYEKIIELGRSLPPMPVEYQTTENVIKGCQSIVYLHSELYDGQMIFSASSDALISSGLAALLIKAYNRMTPEFVLKNKPTFLDDLQIFTSLSPGRSNGLASMYLHMQKDAMKFLISV